MGTTEIYKSSPDGLMEMTYREFADGSSEEEIYEYLCEDCWDYTYEYISITADGVETYEFTDAYGNTNTETYDSMGNEYFGSWEDEEGNVYEEYMDMEGNYYVEFYGADGSYTQDIYHPDGTNTYIDEQGNEYLYDNYGQEIYDAYEDEYGNMVYEKYDDEGNMITEVVDAETGERTETKTNEEGLVMVHEEWDSMGNYVVYLEDAVSGDRIIEVYDYMGYITRTVYFADGTTETQKTDEWGNEVQEGYYDENDNYVVTKFDQMLGADVTITTDPWGYRTEEWCDDMDCYVMEYDPTGAEIVRLPTASAPQNLAVGDRAGASWYHITWEASADDGGYPITDYTVYWDDYSYGDWFMPIGSVWMDMGDEVLEMELDAWDPFMEMQFYVVAWTEAGEGDASDIIGVVAIDYCDETVEDCDFESFFGDEAEEFAEWPYGWIGDRVSDTTYHLVWDAPYDPYGFYGTPLGYIVYADNFAPGGSRDDPFVPIARVDGSEEWGNEWMMDITMDMHTGRCTAPPSGEGEDFDSGVFVPTFEDFRMAFEDLGYTIDEPTYDLLMEGEQANEGSLKQQEILWQLMEVFEIYDEYELLDLFYMVWDYVYMTDDDWADYYYDDYTYDDWAFPSYEELAWAFEELGYYIDEDAYWVLYDGYHAASGSSEEVDNMYLLMDYFQLTSEDEFFELISEVMMMFEGDDYYYGGDFDGETRYDVFSDAFDSLNEELTVEVYELLV
jgi:hypothetical protein